MFVNHWNKNIYIILLVMLFNIHVKANIDNLNKLLDTTIDWNYINTPFLDVVEDIQKNNGIDIAVDAEVTNTLFRVKSNINVNLQLNNVSLRNALDIFLDTFNLVYVYRNNAVFITYPNSSYTKKAPVIKSYNIHELIPNIQADFPPLPIQPEMKKYVDKLKNTYSNADTNKLKDLIKTIVARETWNNEQNSITVLNSNMFVSQQEFVHNEIKNILQAISKKRSLISIDFQILVVENKVLQRELQNFYSPNITSQVIQSLLKKKNNDVRILSQSSALEYTQQFVFFTDRNEASKSTPQVSCVVRPTLLSTNKVLLDFCSVVEQESSYKDLKGTAYQNQATSFIIPLNTKVCVGISPFLKTTSLLFLMRLSEITHSGKDTIRDQNQPLPANFQKKLSLSYSNEPLTKVVAEIRNASQANIVVDPHIFTQIIGDEDSLRVTFHVKSSTVENILNLLISITKLRLIRRGNVLILTTKNRYPLPPQLKFYNITDVIFAQKENMDVQEKKLINVVESAVVKQSWRDNRHGIGIWQGNLIVRQAPENQLKIAEKIGFIQDLYIKNLKPVTVWAFLVRNGEIQPKSLTVIQGRNEDKLFVSSGIRSAKDKYEVILETTPVIKENNKIALEVLWRSRLGRYSQRSINVEVENNTSSLVASIPYGDAQYQIFIGARIPEYPDIKGTSKISVECRPKVVSIGKVFRYRMRVRNTGTIVSKNTVAVVKLPSGFQHKSGLNIFSIPIGDLESQESYILSLPIKPTLGGVRSVQVDVQSQGAKTTRHVLETKVAKYKADISIKCREIMYIKRRTPIIVEVKNSGDLQLQDIRVQIKIPREIAVISADNNAKVAGQDVTWLLPSLNAKKTFLFKIFIQSDKEHNKCIAAQISSKQTAVKTTKCCSKWRGFPAVHLEGKSSSYVVEKGERFRYDIILRNRGTALDKNIKVILNCSEKLRPVKIIGTNQGKIINQVVEYKKYAELNVKDEAVFSVLLEAIEKGSAKLEASFQSTTLIKPILEEDRINVY